jgi:aminomethyltransferase
VSTEEINETQALRTTPLVASHQAAGGRMVPFAGWLMPVQYPTGIVAEHLHTRQQASLFDCSHMGQFRLRGHDLPAVLDRLLPRPVADQPLGTCRYNFLLADDGTVVDDIVVYRVDHDHYYLVVNAGTRLGDAAYLRAALPPHIAFADESDATAKLDLQGPAARTVLAQLGLLAERLPRYFRFCETTLAGIPLLLSRTGYTGELGYELYCAADRAVELWQLLLAQAPVRPAGLGARDTLRLEMGYPLYGHELHRQTTPVAAGFGHLLKLERDFPGAAALRQPPPQRLVGIRLQSRRVARETTPVHLPDGTSVGMVTSGSYSPSLQTAIAMAYVAVAHTAPGTLLHLGTAKATLPGTVVPLPFYTQGTARQP